MSDEIPPSNLVTAPDRPPPPQAAGVLWTLRLDRLRWRIGPVSELRAFGAVTLGWLLVGWNRFGFQGIDAPRSVVRFLLVGLYGWLLSAVAVTVGLALLQRSAPPVTAEAADGDLPDQRLALSIQRVLHLTGVAHQGLVIIGVLMVITQLIPIPGLLWLSAILTLVVWMPAMMVVGSSTITASMSRAAVIVVPVHLVWLVVVGRFLLDRVGHLL